jgi:hypothetical protein
MASMLDVELATYNRHRDELLGSAEGRFVLIRGSEVRGTFESQADGVARGYQDFGNVPFLVKRIERIETADLFTSHLLALWRS